MKERVNRIRTLAGEIEYLKGRRKKIDKRLKDLTLLLDQEKKNLRKG